MVTPIEERTARDPCVGRPRDDVAFFKSYRPNPAGPSYSKSMGLLRQALTQSAADLEGPFLTPFSQNECSTVVTYNLKTGGLSAALVWRVDKTANLIEPRSAMAKTVASYLSKAHPIAAIARLLIGSETATRIREGQP